MMMALIWPQHFFYAIYIDTVIDITMNLNYIHYDKAALFCLTDL